MNEELLILIEQVIAQLRLEQQTLEQGSAEYARKAEVINAFTTSLDKLRGRINSTQLEVQQLEASFIALFNAIERGEGYAAKYFTGSQFPTSIKASEVTQAYRNVPVGQQPVQAIPVSEKPDATSQQEDQADKALIQKLEQTLERLNRSLAESGGQPNEEISGQIKDFENALRALRGEVATTAEQMSLLKKNLASANLENIGAIPQQVQQESIKSTVEEVISQPVQKPTPVATRSDVDTINRINEIVTALSIENSNLQEGSKEYKARERIINSFGQAIQKLTGDVKASPAEIQRLTQQFNKLIDTIDAGEARLGNRRKFGVGGERFRFSQFEQFKAEPVQIQTPGYAEVPGITQGPETRPERIAQGKGTLSRLLTPSKEDLEREKKADKETIRNIEAYINERDKELGAIFRMRREIAEREEKDEEKAAKLPDQRLGEISAQRAADDAELKRARDKKAEADKQAADAEKAAQQAQADLEKRQTPIVREQIRQAREELRKAQKAAREADAERAKIEAEVARVQARLNLDKFLPGGTEAAQRLFTKAQKVDPNFTPDRIRDVTLEPSTGISKVKYEYEVADGIFKKATFTVDKFGHTLLDTQRRFQNFTQRIGRDIVEAAQWGIAIGVVYGSLAKLNEVIQISIRNQAALADVQITLGSATQSVSEIFEAAAEIAKETGEELGGVIEAYNLAYRATGGIEDSTVRFTIANKLLSDSLVLSKLSTLNQAEAIDILSAGLKQTARAGEPLEETLSRGSQLLDQWVKTTKVANVDLGTLATGFSVVGDAAEAAGVGADKLNAVIALVAETSAQSGKEVANTTRALISGFQSDKAQDELRNLGIAITDSEGKARGFLDIMEQLYNLRQSGTLTDEQFSKLTLALGGGVRRSASFATFIENFGKIRQIEADTASAGGESAEALAKKLETVETASTRLGNAFQALAQAVGEDGGVLDLFKAGLDTLTLFTEALTNLTEVAGRAGPALATSMAALLILRSRPGWASALGSAVGGTAYDATMAIGNRINPPTGNPYGVIDLRRELVNERRATNVATFAKTWGAPAIGAVASVAAPAIQNLVQDRDAQAAGNVIGGAIGAGLGAFVGGPGGLLIGSTLGSAIGEGIVNFVEGYKINFADLGEDIIVPPETPEDVAGLTTQQRLQKQYETQLDEIGGRVVGIDFIDKFIVRAEAQLNDFVMGIALGDSYLGMNESQYVQMRAGREGTPEEVAELKRLYDQITAPQRALQELSERAKSEYAQPIEIAQKAQEAELLNRRNRNQIGTAAYGRGLSTLAGASTAIAGDFATFGEDYMDQYQKTAEQFASMMAKIRSEASSEEIDVLNELEVSVTKAKLAMDDGSGSVDDYATALQDAIKYVDILNTKVMSQAKLFQRVVVEDVSIAPDLTNQGVSSQSISQDLVSRAQEITQERLQEQVDMGAIVAEQAAAIIDSYEDIILNFNGLVSLAKDTTTEDLQKAIEEFKELGKLMEKEKSIGFQTFDMTQAEYQALQPQYEQLLKQLEGQGYVAQDEEMINIFEDGISKDRKDFKVLQLLLSQIRDIEQKQLDGMFNLPEGASFWIPYDAAKLMAAGGNQQQVTTPNVTAPGTTTTTTTQQMGTQVNVKGTSPSPVIPPPSGISNTAPIPLLTYSQMTQKFKQADQDSYLLDYATMTKKFRDADQASMPADTPVIEKLGQIVDAILSVNETFKLGFNPSGNTAPDEIEKPLSRQFAEADKEASDAGLDLKGIIEAIFAAKNQTDAILLAPITDLAETLRSLFGTSTDNTSVTAPTASNSVNNLNNIAQNLSTRLSLNIDNRTTLNVDGRVLASVVKQYLKNDFIRYSGGTGNKNLSVI